MGVMKRKKLICASIVLLLTISCSMGTTKIGEITAHPRDYAGKEVTISGQVTETFSLFVVRYYILKDDSGEITVVTDRPLPAQGEQIKTTGIVKEAFSIGTKTTLVLVENTQR